LIAATSEIARQVVSDKPVVFIENLLNKKEIEEKILPFLTK
jgi:PTS system ascorbate-specific IIB component